MPEPPLRAVLDLGSNTFHLLIARLLPGDVLEAVYRERRYVKLAEGSTDHIIPAAWDRAFSALNQFRKILTEYGDPRVTVLGTAMLRRATNGEDFLRAAAALDLPVTIISGDREAALIARGVTTVLPPDAGRVLIMDIGGGSTEFILCELGSTLFARSFPVGLVNLYDRFFRTDPITKTDLMALRTYLTDVFAPLRSALSTHPTHHLVGAAGAFEILVAGNGASATYQELPPTVIEDLLGELVSRSPAERAAHPAVPPERAELIVVALVLARLVMDLAGVDRLGVSAYALKEGALLE